MLATLGLVHYEKLRRRSPAVNSGQTWDQFLVAIIMLVNRLGRTPRPEGLPF
jgi:hypothetical protein